MLNIEFSDGVAPVKIVGPRVQLIGVTKFTMPDDVDSDDGDSLQMERDPFATDAEAIIEFAGRGCYRSWDKPNPATATTEGYMRNILAKKHFSVLRHAQATFYITGISRAFSHEMVTHAHIARSQESQRYVPADSINAVLPPVIRDWPGIRDAQGNFHPNEFSESVRLMRNTYTQMVKALEADGITGKKARETARYLLPSGVETRMTATGNLQAWLEFLTKRTSIHAMAEFREVANLIWHHLIGIAPTIFSEETRRVWDADYAATVAAARETAWAEADQIKAEAAQLMIPEAES